MNGITVISSGGRTFAVVRRIAQILAVPPSACLISHLAPRSIHPSRHIQAGGHVSQLLLRDGDFGVDRAVPLGRDPQVPDGILGRHKMLG
jgi:hypothetical protein